MSGLAKAFVVINLILALFFLGASATLFQTNKNWKKVAEDGQGSLVVLRDAAKAQKDKLNGKIDSLEGNNSTLKGENGLLSNQKRELENAVGDLRKDIANLQTEATSLASQIAQKDLHLQDRDNALAAKDEQIDRLSQEKADADEQRKAAVMASARDRLDRETLARQLEDVTRLHQETQEELANKSLMLDGLASAGVQLPDLGVQIAPKIDGMIVAVRDDIVVLSVGRDDLVKEGYEFTVYEGERFVGKVKVQSVLGDMSGARVLFTENGSSIQAGQKATTRLTG